MELKVITPYFKGIWLWKCFTIHFLLVLLVAALMVINNDRYLGRAGIDATLNTS